MNNKRNEDGEDDVSVFPRFELLAKPRNVEYIARINKGFVHSEQFDEIVYALDNASEGDEFTLNLTTPGGSLQSVIPLLNSINNTAAHVHVHAESDVASAGTFILMCAHSVSMNDYVEVMFHNVSFGAGGAGYKVERQVEHVLKSSKRILRDMYRHFLTEDEINRLLTGTDFYMDREEFLERYQNRAQLMEAEIEGLIAELEAEKEKAAKKPRKRKPLTISNKDVDTTEEAA